LAIRRFAPALVVVTALSRAFAQSVPEPPVRTIWSDAQDGATISPDGKLIAFVDWNVGNVAVRDVGNGIHRALPDATSTGFPEPYFVFSPKSDAIVFPFGNNLTGSPFAYELRRIDLASGAHEVLASFPPDVALIVPLTWHPDVGLLFNKIAADRTTELLVLNPATKAVRVLQRRRAEAGAAWQAFFTRDGSAVAILANDTIELIKLADGTGRPLGMHAQVLLGWTADERTLLFHGARNGITGNWSVAIAQGRNPGTPMLVRRTAPGVRPAGRAADGVYDLEPAQTPGLFRAVVDPASGGLVTAPQRILPTPGYTPVHPVWSKDGMRLAFALAVSNRNENRIVIADGARGEPREIAKTDLRVTGLDWSADGKFLIVGGRAMTRDAAWVGRINVASGAIEKLVTGAPTAALAAGPDGGVVFSRAALAGSRSVDVMHLRGPGGTLRTLATYTIDDLPRSLSVSPDGRWVAILKSIPNRSASALVLLPTAGGETRTVLQLERPDALELNQGSVPWMADGRSVIVLVRRMGKRQLVAVRVDSGEMTALPFAPQQGGRRSLTLHPDGRQIVYVDGAGRDELKVLIDRDELRSGVR
jgi:hypothetical protein